ncbi:MAG: pilus assembly protein [Firmicutes bacterium]|nr:pilus assembly protein [Bacillota bacterium]MCL5057220.1 pilus assembly protein [Actinomycetota bacterium]
MSTDSGRAAGSKPISRFNKQEGAILLELVIVLSLLTAVFLATITFSLLFADYYGAQKVAGEGAREASITKDTGLAGEKARQAAWLWGLDPDRTEIEFTRGGSGITCTVNYTARPFSKTFPLLLNEGKLNDCHLSAKAIYTWSDTR